MADYLTDTWSLMRAVKANLQAYKSDADVLQLNKGDINWGLGFILPKTVFPAITVFPKAKIFGPRRGGGRSVVEYQFSADIYSPMRTDLAEAKAWANKATEDVKRALKQAQHMPEGGIKHCFKVSVTGVQVGESPVDKGRNFQSTTQVSFSCFARHDWEGTANEGYPQLETDSADFAARVFTLIKKNTKQVDRINAWVSIVGKPLTKTPALLLLPADEHYVEEEFAGKTDMLVRPMVYTLVSRAYPKAATLRENIELADKLVAGIERGYKVEGYAKDVAISDITYDWGSDSDTFQFFSSIAAHYSCYQTATRIKRSE